MLIYSDWTLRVRLRVDSMDSKDAADQKAAMRSAMVLIIF
jgi:hypothetical protein